MMTLYHYSRTAEAYRQQRQNARQRILKLLADGNKRRVKDVAEALELSINFTKEILTGLHNEGTLLRTETPDLRTKNQKMSAWFHIRETQP